MCHSEFGPGTEYGCRLVNPPGHLSATLRGSIARNVVRILCLVTL